METFLSLKNVVLNDRSFADRLHLGSAERFLVNSIQRDTKPKTISEQKQAVIGFILRKCVDDPLWLKKA